MLKLEKRRGEIKIKLSKGLAKKHRHLSDIERLEMQIARIQLSTRTFWGCLIPLHDKLRMRLNWYYKWHTLPTAKPIHYLVITLYLLGLPFMFYNFPQKPPEAKAVTYDFPRWEWLNPTPTGNNLNKVTTCTYDNSLLAVGNIGTILKSFDEGQTWTQQYSGTTSDLYDVVCVASDKIITIGTQGTVLQYNGISWTAIANTGSNNFAKIGYLNDTNLVIVGSSGAIYHISYTGSSWQSESIPGVSGTFTSVSPLSSTAAIAVGSSGAIYHVFSNGSSWQAEAISGTSAGFTAVSTLNTTSAIAVGSSGAIYRIYYNGSAWQLTNLSSGTKNFKSLVTVDSTQALAVGNNGSQRIYYDGSAWQTSSINTAGAFYDISLVSATEAIAIGTNSQTSRLYYNGSSWVYSSIYSRGTSMFKSLVTINSTSLVTVGMAGVIGKVVNTGSWQLTDVTVSNTNSLGKIVALDSTQAIALGMSGMAFYLYKNGSVWNTSSITTGTTRMFYGADKISSTEVLATANGAGYGIYDIKYNGSSWQTTLIYTPPNVVRNIVALSSTEAITVGDSGLIYRIYYNGSSWQIEDLSQITDNLYEVASISSTEAIAVGPGGIYRIYYNGSSWQSELISSSTTINHLTVLDSTNLIGVGGTIARIYYDGASWQVTDMSVSGSLYSVKTLSPTQALAVGAQGLIYYIYYDGASWQLSDISVAATYHLYDVATLGSTQALVVGDGGSILKLTFNGSSWSTAVQTSITSNDLISAIYMDSQPIAVGTGSSIVTFYSPANATATNLLLSLPGQSFADETSPNISGTPSEARVGEPYLVKTYAVDSSNKLDRGIPYLVSFTTSDPNDSNPAPTYLENGVSVSEYACNSDSATRVNNPCGVGSTNITFHTPGTWTITVNDAGGSGLSSATSSSITVLPGLPSKLALVSLPSSLAAGSVSAQSKVRLQDIYGNTTTATSDTTIHLTTTSAKGRFSTSSSGPWSLESLDITIPSGSSEASFYYLDLATGSPTISASSSGLTSISSSLTITTGQLSQSSLSLSRSSLSAGESLNATLTLKDNSGTPLSGKTVTLLSSRNTNSTIDSITPSSATTDGSGVTNFSVTSNLAGSLTITALDQTDNLYVTDEEQVTFTPGPVSQLFLSGLSSLVEAGTSQQGTVTLKDRYNNLAANARGKLEFSSSDSRADLPSSYAYTNGDNGSHTFPFVFKGAGDKKLTVAYPSTGASTNYVFSVTPASVSSTHSTISSDKERIKDNGEDKAAITVTLKDSYDNGVKGKEVELKSSRDEDTVKALKSKSDATSSNGEALFSLTSTKEGEAILTAVDMTDKLVLLDGLSLTIYKAPPIDSLPPVFKKIHRLLQPIAEAAAAVGLLIFGAQGASYFLVFISGTLRGKKRSRPWGIVFDALTGQPVDLAVVRLFEAQTKQLIQTKVTDMEGRFGFSVTPGTYVLSVTKGGYLFPITKGTLSRLVRGEGCYVGSHITIADKTTHLSLSIPLEPEQSTLHLKAKIRLILRNSLETITVTASHIFLPLMIVGLVMTIITAYLVQDTRSYLSAILYVLLITLFILQRSRRLHQLGKVINTQGKPLPDTAIFLYDQEYQNLKATTQSDKQGHFSLFVPQGQYYLLAQKEGYLFPPAHQLPRKLKGNIYKGGILELKGPGYVSPMVVMEGE